MIQPNPLIDQFLLEGCMRCSLGATPACKVHGWTDILEFLRQLLLETELKEERKWGMPTYTLNGKNVVILGVFKESCVLSFLKGGLLVRAIEVERSGKKAIPKPANQVLPEELHQKFVEHPGLEAAFFSLTPGRQRGYLIHFSGAKQSPTRLCRIEKCVPKIFAGKGMMD